MHRAVLCFSAGYPPGYPPGDMVGSAAAPIQNHVRSAAHTRLRGPLFLRRTGLLDSSVEPRDVVCLWRFKSNFTVVPAETDLPLSLASAHPRRVNNVVCLPTRISPNRCPSLNERVGRAQCLTRCDGAPACSPGTDDTMSSCCNIMLKRHARLLLKILRVCAMLFFGVCRRW